MADEQTNDPGSAPSPGRPEDEGQQAHREPQVRAQQTEGQASGPPDTGEADQPTSAADAERALRAAQDAIRGLNAASSEASDDEGAEPAEAAAAGAASAEAETPPAARGGDAVGQGGGGGAGGGGKPVDLPKFDARTGEAPSRSLDLLSDVNLNVRIELGRTRMLVEDVLRLGEGAVVELDKLAGDPVDVFVNGRPVARGEVLVLNDNFCIRISEILDEGKERVQREAAG